MNRLSLRSPDRSRRRWEKTIKAAEQQRLNSDHTSSSDTKIGRLSSRPNRLAAALIATAVLGGVSAKVVYPVVRGETGSPIAAKITPETLDRQDSEITGSQAKKIDKKQAESKKTSSPKNNGETAKQTRFIKVPKGALLGRADRSITPRTSNNLSQTEPTAPSTSKNADATPTANKTSNQNQEAQAEHKANNTGETYSNTGGASAAQANKISTTEGVAGGASYSSAPEAGGAKADIT